MSTTQTDNFLKKIYTQLKFENSNGWYSLTSATKQPTLSQTFWFQQAQKLGADSILFVRNYPTVLFFKLDNNNGAGITDIEESIRQLHLNVWNTSRVPLFFVAIPGELRIYSAYQKPIKTLAEWQSTQQYLKRVTHITQILELMEFDAPSIESGQLFQNRKRVFNRENRVDQWLLKNLRLLRKKLGGENKEKRAFIHALIGRSIFIRYLEDRQVLVADYFTDKAISKQTNYTCYIDVLGSKKDTYNLFRKLNKDFNGDLFPLDPIEENLIEATDLLLLQNFLQGRSMGQPDLLFWAYKFDIIPIELISSIYEEFYHEHGDDDKGTHYTPTTLVEFVLTECLPQDKINKTIKILDPACGSGIFLVEAFKRIVNATCYQQGIEPHQLPQTELILLLTNHIFGIDIDKSAIQIAAFSLYLAFLDFRKPRDIRQHTQLPKLIYNPNNPNSGNNLFATNTFYLTPPEKNELDKKINHKKRYKGKAQNQWMFNQPELPLNNVTFDVIIGNPPWGSVEKKQKKQKNISAEWCKAFNYPIGDEELSQCFIWRVQRLLKEDGKIGLLVPTGTLVKHQKNSKDFRQQWLKENNILAVYNFTHVRHIFFRKQKKDAVSPFIAVFFKPATPQDIVQNKIKYVSIKQSAFVQQLQAVIINKADLHQVRQSDFILKDWLWKTYMWGGPNDAELIAELKSCYPPFSNFVSHYGRGYKEGGKKNRHTSEANVDFELDNENFYHHDNFNNLVTPIKHRPLHALGDPEIYTGSRLLVRRGIRRSGNKYGEIQSRLAYIPFLFPSSILSFRLDNLSEDKHKILLGILYSSLAKYYHFLTCSTWGFWHYEIHEEEHLALPIHFPEDKLLQTKIIKAVEQLTPGPNPSIWAKDQQNAQHILDEAIFELYQLSEAQKDLVRDLNTITLEFFYKGTNALALKPPTVQYLQTYSQAFLEIWQERLALKAMELEVTIFAPHNGLLCAMSFELKALGTVQTQQPITDNSQWQTWFRRMANVLYKKYSHGIYIDTVVKEVSQSSLFIIKRAEKRHWTKSQARQDAQELLMKVFELEWISNGSKTA